MKFNIFVTTLVAASSLSLTSCKNGTWSEVGDDVEMLSLIDKKLITQASCYGNTTSWVATINALELL